jgi:hypothetical protein
MGEIRISLTNFIAVGLMAYVFVWIAQRALKKTPVAAYVAL